jgi:hypothetical protein
MSKAPWSPRPDGLRRHPQLAALAALDHQLRLVVGVLAAVHEGQDDALPELHQARGIARVARTLQSQIDAYRRLVAAPPKAAVSPERQNPRRR